MLEFGWELYGGEDLICPATERCYVDLVQQLCSLSSPVLSGHLGSVSAPGGFERLGEIHMFSLFFLCFCTFFHRFSPFVLYFHHFSCDVLSFFLRIEGRQRRSWCRGEVTRAFAACCGIACHRCYVFEPQDVRFCTGASLLGHWVILHGLQELEQRASEARVLIGPIMSYFLTFKTYLRLNIVF